MKLEVVLIRQLRYFSEIEQINSVSKCLNCKSGLKKQAGNIKMNENPSSKLLLVGNFLLITLVFGVSYSHEPLYSSNQNTYFLHGLADGGLGFLERDWLARTTDPFPVFSFLVSITFRNLHEYAFNLYYLAILGVYIYSILGIASHTHNIDSSGTKYLTYFAFVTFLHSALFDKVFSETPTYGVAGQYILGPVFQPSTFGVFIVLSIYAFLRGKPFLAILFSSVAATFHPTYLLSAAVLTSSYMITIFKENKDIKKVLLLGVTAFLLILPVLCYTYFSFGPTSPENLSRARSILVDHMPGHAKPSYWLGIGSVFQIFIVVVALYIVRKSKLFTVLFLSFLVSVLLTIVQVISGSNGLALLFPWRISVFLVPISSCLIVASIVSTGFQKFGHQILRHDKVIKSRVLLAMLILTLSGGLITIRRFVKATKADNIPVMNFVAARRQPSNLYLIPIEMQRFRLYTGVPIFVDKKSHPYKDIEVIEWYGRIQIANKFYQARAETARSILREIVSNYGITHVVVENNQSEIDSEFLYKTYQDNNFAVYEVGAHR